MEKPFEKKDGCYLSDKVQVGEIINDYIRGLCLIRRKIPGVWDDADTSVRKIPHPGLLLVQGDIPDEPHVCPGDEPAVDDF